MVRILYVCFVYGELLSFNILFDTKAVPTKTIRYLILYTNILVFQNKKYLVELKQYFFLLRVLSSVEEPEPEAGIRAFFRGSRSREPVKKGPDLSV